MASNSAMGDTTRALPASTSASTSSQQQQGVAPWPLPPFPLPFPPPNLFPFPLPGGPSGLPVPAAGLAMLEALPMGQLLASSLSAATGVDLAQQQQPSSLAGLTGTLQGGGASGASGSNTREALRFMLSPEGALGQRWWDSAAGVIQAWRSLARNPLPHTPPPHTSAGTWFRSFVMDELVRSVDALSRDQARALAMQLGLGAVNVPVLLPGARKQWLPLAPAVSEEDQRVVANVAKVLAFLTRSSERRAQQAGGVDAAVVTDLLPVLPTVAQEVRSCAREHASGTLVTTSGRCHRASTALLCPLPLWLQVLPELSQKLASRVAARLVRELYA